MRGGKLHRRFPPTPLAHPHPPNNPQLFKKRTLNSLLNPTQRAAKKATTTPSPSFGSSRLQLECHVRRRRRRRRHFRSAAAKEHRPLALCALPSPPSRGEKGRIGFSPGYYSLHALDLLGTVLQGEQRMVRLDLSVTSIQTAWLCMWTSLRCLL